MELLIRPGCNDTSAAWCLWCDRTVKVPLLILWQFAWNSTCLTVPVTDYIYGSLAVCTQHRRHKHLDKILKGDNILVTTKLSSSLLFFFLFFSIVTASQGWRPRLSLLVEVCQFCKEQKMFGSFIAEIWKIDLITFRFNLLSSLLHSVFLSI